MSNEQPIFNSSNLPWDNPYLTTKLREEYDRVNKRRKASLIILDGSMGEGKTTFAVEIGDEFNKYRGHGIIDLNPSTCIQYAYGGADFLSKLPKVYEAGFPVIIYDEAGDFDKRAALSKFNKTLNYVFQTYRAYKIIVIMCVPDFSVLENRLLKEKVPRLLLHCFDKQELYSNFKAYGLYRMSWVKENMKKYIIPEMAYNFTKQNFKGRFRNLSESRCKLLDQISTKKKMHSVKKSTVMIDGLMTIKDLSAKLNKSIWTVMLEMKTHGIKSKQSIGRQLYYDEHALFQLKNYFQNKNYNRRKRR